MMKPTKTNILIIAYYYPPMLGAGSQRLNGLAKYLPQYGFNPIVVTPKHEQRTPRPNIIETEYPGPVSAKFKKFLRPGHAKGEGNQIRHSDAFEHKNFLTKFLKNAIEEIFMYPDDQKNWMEPGYTAAKEAAITHEVKAVISSSGPVTTHCIAHRLQNSCKIPWIADFRDLWTQNHNYHFSPARKYFEERLEKKTLSNASALTTVSEPFAEELRELHRTRTVQVIPNGFDPDEVVVPERTDTFSISYTGRLYQNHQNPDIFFEAIKELIEEKIIDKNDVKINFYGQHLSWLSDLIARYGLKEIAEQKGSVSKEEASKIQSKSQLLLLFTWNTARGKGVYTAKVYEYLAAQKRIIAIGGEGNVADALLKSTNAGCYCTNKNEVKEYLRDCYKEFKAKGALDFHGIDKEIGKYSYVEVAKQFACLLDAMV